MSKQDGSDLEATAIMIWRFKDAPAEYQALGGSRAPELWVIFLPECAPELQPIVNAKWLKRIDHVAKVEGGWVYIGA